MSFNREKHIKYWRMNANILPDHYIPTDSSRMTLGYFTVAALDLLGILDDVKPQDRQSWTRWIYSCQCEEGGFRGFTGTDLGQQRSDSNRGWDPPSVPATFFALGALLVLGDDLRQVKREQCLQWLPKLQRKDGSFGEVLDVSGDIQGGTDLRYCCCAAGIVYILKSPRDTHDLTIDQEALVAYIQSCQNYNGGFGESPFKEPHSGLTYCAVAALEFVRRLQSDSADTATRTISSTGDVIRWMLERQTNILEEEIEDDETDEEYDSAHESKVYSNTLPSRTASEFEKSQLIAGFNGRDGKIADTCYCFWNVGALAILDAQHLIHEEGMKSYLLDKVQHMIGGFGKGIGAPPDVLHSYLGLAALSLVEQDGIKAVDPLMCISRDATAQIHNLAWKSSS